MIVQRDHQRRPLSPTTSQHPAPRTATNGTQSSHSRARARDLALQLDLERAQPAKRPRERA